MFLILCAHVSSAGSALNRRALALFTIIGLSFSLGGLVTAGPIEQARPMPSGRGFNGAAVVGNYLYLIGGREPDPASPAIETHALMTTVGVINPDGGIAAWGTATTIPSPRYYIGNSTMVLGDMIYVFGGSDDVLGGTSLDTVIYNRAQPDGSLGAWQTAPAFGEGLSTPVTVATPGHLHVIGGLMNDDSISPNVWTNQLRADGSLWRWEKSAPLPVGLWYHQAGVVAGRVYVWGGLQTPSSESTSSAIYSAPVLGTGKLGEWRRESVRLPDGFYASSTSVVGTYLMSFSPRYAGRVLSNDVWWTNITPAGMTNWEKFPTTITNKVYHASAADYGRGSIYMLGGRGPTTEDDLLRDVYIFRLSPQVYSAVEQAWGGNASQQANTVSTQNAVRSRSITDSPAVAGFQEIAFAQFRAGSERLPLVMYFTVPSALPSKEQMEILTPDALEQLARRASLAWIDASKDPQTTQSRGVFRVPTWIFFNRRGEEVTRVSDKMSVAELNSAIDALN